MTGPDRPVGGLPEWPRVPTTPQDQDAPPEPDAPPDQDVPDAPTSEDTMPPDPVAPDPVAPDPVAPDPGAPDPVAPNPAPAASTSPAPAPAASTPNLSKDSAPAEPAPAEPANAEPAIAETSPAETSPNDVPAPRTGERGPWLRAGVLGLVCLVLAVASVVLLGKGRDQDRRADREVALAAVQDPSGPALTAAATAVERLLSYDYTRLDADFAAGQALLTPDYRVKYADFTTKLVRPPALQAKARVVARLQVLAPTEATTADRVVVLAFVDQTTTSALLSAPAVDQSRVTLTLVPADGMWLVQDLVVTGSQPGSG